MSVFMTARAVLCDKYTDRITVSYRSKDPQAEYKVLNKYELVRWPMIGVPQRVGATGKLFLEIYHVLTRSYDP